MSWDQRIKESKLGLFVIGSAALVAGVCLILAWWPDVVTVFRGVGGMFVALGGLLLLYMVKE